MLMTNDLELYREQGRLVAEARRHKDESRAKFEYNLFIKMKGYETKEDKIKAEEAFKEGYKEFTSNYK